MKPIINLTKPKPLAEIVTCCTPPGADRNVRINGRVSKFQLLKRETGELVFGATNPQGFCRWCNKVFDGTEPVKPHEWDKDDELDSLILHMAENCAPFAVKA